MRYLILTFFLLAIFSVCAQNLVPNFGFEQYTVCPGSHTQSAEKFVLPGWSSANAGTPDHFHVCSSGDADVPYNWAGVADAFEGQGYVGIFLWVKDRDYREYIQAKLSEPLAKDSIYRVSFRYKLSSYSKFSVDRIGLTFSDKPWRQLHDHEVTIHPTLAVVHDSALTKQTGLWELASMDYRADGSEQIIVIGNFWTQSETKSYFIKFRPVSEDMLANAAYYYIDNVEVRLKSEIDRVERQQNILTYEQLRTDTTYVLRNIQFDYDSYRLLTPSFEELDRLTSFLIARPKLRIQIFGHTDDQGGDQYNVQLSQRRAASVMNYLISMGVTKDRVESFGYGKSRPLLDQRTEEARQLNRRVEIRFLFTDL